MPEPTPQDALRKVHEACPCAIRNCRYLCGARFAASVSEQTYWRCTCGPDATNGWKTLKDPCLWPGHAATDALDKVKDRERDTAVQAAKEEMRDRIIAWHTQQAEELAACEDEPGSPEDLRHGIGAVEHFASIEAIKGMPLDEEPKP